MQLHFNIQCPPAAIIRAPFLEVGFLDNTECIGTFAFVVEDSVLRCCGLDAVGAGTEHVAAPFIDVAFFDQGIVVCGLEGAEGVLDDCDVLRGGMGWVCKCW